MILFAYLPESWTGIEKKRIIVNRTGLPDYAEYGVGYFLEFFPLAIVVGCGIYQIIIHRNNLVIII